jgi:vacuolar protein sorting-associated protein 18
MMLATWLVEFYLSKCDELDDLIVSSSALYDVENVKAERSILEEDLRHFLELHKVCARFISLDLVSILHGPHLG